MGQNFILFQDCTQWAICNFGKTGLGETIASQLTNRVFPIAYQ